MGKCILAGHPPVGGQIGYGRADPLNHQNQFTIPFQPNWVLIVIGNEQTTTGAQIPQMWLRGAPNYNTKVTITDNTNGTATLYISGSAITDYLCGT